VQRGTAILTVQAPASAGRYAYITIKDLTLDQNCTTGTYRVCACLAVPYNGYATEGILVENCSFLWARGSAVIGGSDYWDFRACNFYGNTQSPHQLGNPAYAETLFTGKEASGWTSSSGGMTYTAGNVYVGGKWESTPQTTITTSVAHTGSNVQGVSGADYVLWTIPVTTAHGAGTVAVPTGANAVRLYLYSNATTPTLAYGDVIIQLLNASSQQIGSTIKLPGHDVYQNTEAGFCPYLILPWTATGGSAGPIKYVKLTYTATSAPGNTVTYGINDFQVINTTMADNDLYVYDGSDPVYTNMYASGVAPSGQSWWGGRWTACNIVINGTDSSITDYFTEGMIRLSPQSIGGAVEVTGCTLDLAGPANCCVEAFRTCGSNPSGSGAGPSFIAITGLQYYPEGTTSVSETWLMICGYGDITASGINIVMGPSPGTHVHTMRSCASGMGSVVWRDAIIYLTSDLANYCFSPPQVQHNNTMVWDNQGQSYYSYNTTASAWYKALLASAPDAATTKITTTGATFSIQNANTGTATNLYIAPSSGYGQIYLQYNSAAALQLSAYGGTPVIDPLGVYNLQIGSAATKKIGFFGVAPAVQPTNALGDGSGYTLAQLIKALQSIGLIQ
jgi:hypothetical protein